jgi:hypothetical protein
MFLGIIASSLYDRSEKQRIFQGVTKPVFGYGITLSTPRVLGHGKGERMELPLKIEKGDAQFLAQPDIYVERKKGGQLLRFIHPYIKRGFLSDLYISPVDYDSGRKEEPSNQIVIQKGQTIHRDPYTITFTDYDIQSGMGEGASTGISVGARLKVAYKAEAPVALIPVLHMGQGQSKGANRRVKLPGDKAVFVSLLKINADEKTVTLVYEGPGADVKTAQDTEKRKASVILDVSIKPGMTLLWVGTFLMLFGGVVGIFRRRQR